MSNALLGYGSTFATGDGNSPEAFTAFEEVGAIAPPKPSVDVIDTSHEMPPGSAREPFGGFVDWGEVQIQFNFIPGNTSAAGLMTELLTRPVRNRRVTFPNGVKFSFAGFITGFESAEAAGDRLTGSATFKIVGTPTLA
jgi:hypothetical protein